MSDKDLISAAPGFNSNSPYFYKPELSSLSSASKETLSLKLMPKHGLYVAPHHKEALQDQAQNKPDKSEPVLDSSVTVTNQAGFKALVSRKQTAIQGLTFDCGKVTLQTTAQLIKNGWPALRSLNLSSSRLGADGIKHLVNGLWPELMHLDLSNNSLDEEAMFLMTDVGVKWPNLETLDLRSVPNIHHPLLSPLSSLAPISSSPLECFASHHFACLQHKPAECWRHGSSHQAKILKAAELGPEVCHKKCTWIQRLACCTWHTPMIFGTTLHSCQGYSPTQ